MSYRRLTRLDQVIKQRGLTRHDLAVLVGSTTPYINQLICGLRNASPELCQRIIAAFPGEISLADLRPDLAAIFSRIQELEAAANA